MIQNFSSLLAGKVGDYKMPPVPPALDYPGVITKYEFGTSRAKSTPYVRLHVNLTGWPDGFEDDAVTSRINISARTLFVDYWLTDAAKFRLAKLVRECDISEDTPMEVALGEIIGRQVLVLTKHRMSRPRHESQEPEAILEADSLIGLGA